MKEILKFFKLRTIEKKFIQAHILIGAFLIGLFLMLTIRLGFVSLQNQGAYIVTIVTFYAFWMTLGLRITIAFFRQDFKDFKKKILAAQANHLLREKALENIQLSYQEVAAGRIETKLTETLGSVANLIGTNKARLWIRTDAGFELKTFLGAQPTASKIKPSYKTGLAYTFKTGKALISNNPQTDPRFNKNLLKKNPIKNLIHFPLKTDRETIAVLQLADKKGGFTKNDVKLLESIATSFTTALAIAEMCNVLNKKLEKEEQFILDLVHNLQTPLTAARGELEMLTQKRITQKKLADAASFILSCLGKTSTIIRDSLNFATIQSKVEAQPTNLTQLLTEVGEMAQVIGESKGIKIEIRGQKNLAAICNREKILQAFSNVIDNALKFTPQRGKIEIVLRKVNNSAIVKIKDSGRGIAKKDLPRVFERFWKGTGDGQLGSGLGLSITKSIIESQNGQIDLQSRVGKGTVVTIKLPILPKS